MLLNISDFVFMKEYKNKEWFVNNWINTDKSLQTLADEINVHVTTLERWVHKFNLKKPLKYSINEDKITIKDPVFQYFLGLLYADGFNDGNRIGIDLSYDWGYEILLKLKTYFEYSGKIGVYKNSKGNRVRYRLYISNSKFVTLCTSLGVVPKKISKLRLPKLPQYNHFLRGFIDGDGNIHKGQIRWYCHSKDFNNDIKDLLKFGSIYSHKLGGTTYGVYGKNAQILINFIYQDQHYCLSNKLKKAKFHFEI